MMEMWLKWSTLVFLTVSVAATVISGQAPVILGEKPKVEIPYGSPLTLHCSVNTVGYDRFRVEWYFICAGPSCINNSLISKTIFNRSANGDGQDTILLNHTSHATDDNSGWYFCQVTVEIPFLHVKKSNGTEVVISMSMEHTTQLPLFIDTSKQATVSPIHQHINWWLWVSLGVSAVVLLVLMLMCILLRRRYRRSRDDPIYANTHRKQPSPRPEMSADNLKAVPSSQNLRNPSPGRTYEPGKRRHRQ